MVTSMKLTVGQKIDLLLAIFASAVIFIFGVAVGVGHMGNLAEKPDGFTEVLGT